MENFFEIFIAGVTALVAIAVYTKSFISERPFVTAELPLTTCDFPEHSKSGRLPMNFLILRNSGNHPALITRFATRPAVTYHPQGTPKAEALYPEWMDPNRVNHHEALGYAHALGPGASSQWLAIDDDFRLLCNYYEKSPELNLFVQILIEYEDNMGRLFRTMIQYRYNRDSGGFRVAWPGDPSNKAHKYSQYYCNNEVIRDWIVGPALKLLGLSGYRTPLTGRGVRHISVNLAEKTDNQRSAPWIIAQP